MWLFKEVQAIYIVLYAILCDVLNHPHGTELVHVVLYFTCLSAFPSASSFAHCQINIFSCFIVLIYRTVFLRKMFLKKNTDSFCKSYVKTRFHAHFVPFPYGVWERMWNSIVSVADHRLFIYSVLCLLRDSL